MLIPVNATATFATTVVNDASTPQFHYCTVMKHCAMGMFGIVNPPSTNVTVDVSKTVSAPVADSTAGNTAKDACEGESVNCWIEKWQGQVSASSSKGYELC